MISVERLEFTYPKNDTPTIKGISFDIQQGEIFGFLGPSGAGKSTTQKVLIRLLKNYDGDIEVLNKKLNNWGTDYYEHIGVGFELPNSYSKLTAIENLQFFGSFYKRPVQDPVALLAMVGLEEDGNKKVSDFSKGMKMRLNFVRSFMHRPDIIFFDEPTSGLDPVNARIMKNIILDLKRKGTTIFLTTHVMQDADELCDRVAFIVDGKIALIDAPKALKLAHGQRLVRVEYRDGLSHQKEYPLDGLGQNEEFLSVLREKDVQTIHTEEATLEDIFIKVTGRSLL